MYKERLLTTCPAVTFRGLDGTGVWTHPPFALTPPAAVQVFGVDAPPGTLLEMAQQVIRSGADALLCQTLTRDILVSTAPLPLRTRGRGRQRGIGDGPRLLGEARRLMATTRATVFVSRGWNKATGTLAPAEGPTGK